MSNNLIQFLAAWLEWAESGAESEELFASDAGLCWNFRRWMVRKCGATFGEALLAEEELQRAFVADGLSKNYPFGGEDTYCEECDLYLVPQNLSRLAWVRSKVEQFATANAK